MTNNNTTSLSGTNVQAGAPVPDASPLFTFEVVPQGQLVNELVSVFSTDFDDKSDEIAAALAGAKSYRCPKDGTVYNYSKCFAAALRCSDTAVLVSAALVVERQVSNGKTKSCVWELVWFNSVNNCRGSGAGSLLFRDLHALAVERGITALLVESSNRALTYWLTRPFPIMRTVLRRTKNGAADLINYLDENRPEEAIRHRLITEELLLPKAADEDSAPTSKKKKKKQRGQRGGVFSVEGIVPVEAEFLYSDRVFRDSRGNPTASACFSGSPYRYDITSSIHVIFPTSPAFVNKLRPVGLVVNQSKDDLARLRQRCKSQPKEVSQPIVQEQTPWKRVVPTDGGEPYMVNKETGETRFESQEDNHSANKDETGSPPFEFSSAAMSVMRNMMPIRLG